MLAEAEHLFDVIGDCLKFFQQHGDLIHGHVAAPSDEHRHHGAYHDLAEEGFGGCHPNLRPDAQIHARIRISGNR